jgi:hypothetical protein
MPLAAASETRRSLPVDDWKFWRAAGTATFPLMATTISARSWSVRTCTVTSS